MSRIPHTVRLTSPYHYGRNAPPAAVGQILRVLPSAIRYAIRMAFTGRSCRRGRSPVWLEKTSDIRLVDYSGNSDTVLHFEAPPFGEAAEELFRQPTLWPTTPPPEDTGFDLLGDVLADVNAEAEDSDRYDRFLLRRLATFRGGLEGDFTSVRVSGHRFSEDHPAIVTASTVAAARKLDLEIPPRQRVRVVGRLDMIWQSRQGFILKLDDETEVRGLLIDGDLSDLKDLFNQRVVVHGCSVYRPSGRLLRLDAELIEPGANESSFWSYIPSPKSRKLDRKQILQPQTHKSGVAALFGKWPGEETETEILEALKRMG